MNINPEQLYPLTGGDMRVFGDTARIVTTNVEETYQMIEELDKLSGTKTVDRAEQTFNQATLEEARVLLSDFVDQLLEQALLKQKAESTKREMRVAAVLNKLAIQANDESHFGTRRKSLEALVRLVNEHSENAKDAHANAYSAYEELDHLQYGAPGLDVLLEGTIETLLDTLRNTISGASAVEGSAPIEDVGELAGAIEHLRVTDELYKLAHESEADKTEAERFAEKNGSLETFGETGCPSCGMEANQPPAEKCSDLGFHQVGNCGFKPNVYPSPNSLENGEEDLSYREGRDG